MPTTRLPSQEMSLMCRHGENILADETKARRDDRGDESRVSEGEAKGCGTASPGVGLEVV